MKLLQRIGVGSDWGRFVWADMPEGYKRTASESIQQKEYQSLWDKTKKQLEGLSDETVLSDVSVEESFINKVGYGKEFYVSTQVAKMLGETGDWKNMKDFPKTKFIMKTLSAQGKVNDPKNFIGKKLVIANGVVQVLSQDEVVSAPIEEEEVPVVTETAPTETKPIESTTEKIPSVRLEESQVPEGILIPTGTQEIWYSADPATNKNVYYFVTEAEWPIKLESTLLPKGLEETKEVDTIIKEEAEEGNAYATAAPHFLNAELGPVVEEHEPIVNFENTDLPLVGVTKKEEQGNADDDAEPHFLNVQQPREEVNIPFIKPREATELHVEESKIDMQRVESFVKPAVNTPTVPKIITEVPVESSQPEVTEAPIVIETEEPVVTETPKQEIQEVLVEEPVTIEESLVIEPVIEEIAPEKVIVEEKINEEVAPTIVPEIDNTIEANSVLETPITKIETLFIPADVLEQPTEEMVLEMDKSGLPLKIDSPMIPVVTGTEQDLVSLKLGEKSARYQKEQARLAKEKLETERGAAQEVIMNDLDKHCDIEAFKTALGEEKWNDLASADITKKDKTNILFKSDGFEYEVVLELAYASGREGEVYLLTKDEGVYRLDIAADKNIALLEARKMSGPGAANFIEKEEVEEE